MRRHLHAPRLTPGFLQLPLSLFATMFVKSLKLLEGRPIPDSCRDAHFACSHETYVSCVQFHPIDDAVVFLVVVVVTLLVGYLRRRGGS